jgi:DnaD/phage-associated family protein
MSSLNIYQDDCDDATVVSNLFIDEYMGDANVAQIKVFLYLQRMMGAGKLTSVSDIADKFNYPEKDVIRALKYWEKNRLLVIEWDEQKNPIGIRFTNLIKLKQPEQLLPEPKTATKNINLLPSPEPKPTYSLAELRAFKDAEETAQLLFVAEQYLGKTLSSSDISSLIFFSETLHFSGDLIDYLLQYCVERDKKDFRYIEKVAISWAEQGITSPKQVAKAAKKYDKAVYEVMKALGRNSNPTDIEAEYILRWLGEFSFNTEIIFEACQRTVKAVDSHRIDYCDKILSHWKAQDVQHKADIIQLDSAHARKRPTPAATKSGSGAASFNTFKYNEYDFAALEKEFVSNK